MPYLSVHYEITLVRLHAFPFLLITDSLICDFPRIPTTGHFVDVSVVLLMINDNDNIGYRTLNRKMGQGHVGAYVLIGLMKRTVTLTALRLCNCDIPIVHDVREM